MIWVNPCFPMSIPVTCCLAASVPRTQIWLGDRGLICSFQATTRLWTRHTRWLNMLLSSIVLSCFQWQTVNLGKSHKTPEECTAVWYGCQQWCIHISRVYLFEICSCCKKHVRVRSGSVSYLCRNKISANESRWCMCNVSPSSPISQITRDIAQL